MRQKLTHWARVSALALATTTTLALGALASVPAAHAAPDPQLRSVPGYTVQTAYGRAWLCYGWRDTSYHCTQWWHRWGGMLVSDNPAWVPNVMAPAPPIAAPAPLAPAVPLAQPVPTRLPGAGNTATYPWGWCTWGAAALSWRDVSGLGNARDWLANAQRRGYPTGSVPRVGATVVFAPGVQGASWLGHVAHVEAVAPGGRFLVREMAFSGYGGGWGIYSTRWATAGPGVGFIY